MEVPFYYSFTEFKENYNDDFKRWKEVYTEGGEEDFLCAIMDIYGGYFEYDFLGDFFGFREIEKLTRQKYRPEKWESSDYYDERGNYCKNIHISNIIQDINIRLMTADLSNEKDLDKIVSRRELVKILKKYGLLDDEYNSEYIGGYNFIDFNLIMSLELFWEFKMYDDKDWYLHFNNIKYDNFKLSIPKIYNFIKNRQEEIKEPTKSMKPQSNEKMPTIEDIDKEESKGIKLSLPTRITLLNELGFFKLLEGKGYGKTQIEKITAKLLNADERNTRGNINALNPHSGEDLTKYTAGNEANTIKAKGILKYI